MIRNYIKIAFRALIRSKVHSAINIIGLSLGITVCILIVLFVKDEWTFDRFHSRADRIYRVYAREDYGPNEQFFYTVTPFPMGPALKENLPEVEHEVRVQKLGTQVKVGDNAYSETLAIVGRNFFNVFDFRMAKGSSDGVLDKQENIIISDFAARKYFGDADPIGKTLSLQLNESFYDFTVAAVSERVPSNS